ncbi:MAG: HIT family protein [Bacteroidetes bacterium]|nr:HIT family protein [Bacteroidota bacterium]
MDNCVFCSIVKENKPHHEIIWSDDKHIAFLTLNPSRAGHTLVIPRVHSAGTADLSTVQFTDLFAASREVSLLLKSAMASDRVALVTDGSSVAHTHVHLIPLKVGEELGAFPKYTQTPEDLKTTADQIRGHQ